MRRRQRRGLLLVAFGPLLLMGAVFLLPTAIGAVRQPAWTSLLELKDGGLGGPYLRTLLFALASTTICVVGGFLVAVASRSLSIRAAPWAPFMLTPALLGGAAWSFVFKIALLHSAVLADRELFRVAMVMVGIQVWQYLPLCAFMCWLNLKTLPRERMDFAIASRLNTQELVRYVLLPHSASLLPVLGIFLFFFGMHEYSLFDNVLRQSIGTGTELVSHAVVRRYLSAAGVDPKMALTAALAESAAVGVASILALVVLIPVVVLGVRAAVYVLAWMQWEARDRVTRARWCLGTTTAIACGPPVVFAVRHALPFRSIDGATFGVTVLISGVAAVVGTALAAAFSISYRLLAPNLLQRFDGRSMWIFVALGLTLAIPPIGISFAASEWLQYCGAGGAVLASVLWVLGHVLVAFPLLAMFTVATQFGVPSGELDLLSVSGATASESATASFLGRFRANYLLVGLFAFCLVWGEDAVSRQMSDAIPAVSAELARLTSGRSSSYGRAASLVVLLSAVVAVGTAVWQRTFAGRSEEDESAG